MITTKNISTKEETYWVPVTRTETRLAKIKVSATSAKEAQERARSIVRSLSAPTVMLALGETTDAKISFGQPWQPETMEVDATPPVQVIGEERRKA